VECIAQPMTVFSWIAVSLMQIEKRLNRISGHDKLNLLRIAIKAELKIKQNKVA